MADSFADLWNLTAPTSSKSSSNHTSQTLGSASRTASPAASSAPARPNYAPPRNDLFSMLASSGSSSTPSSSKPTSRSISPSMNTAQSQQRQPASSFGRSSPSLAAPADTSSSSDAFSALISDTLSATLTTKAMANMSMAERQANAQRERVRAAEREQEAREKEKSVWSGLDMIGTGSSVGGKAKANSSAGDGGSDDLDDFLGLGSTSSRPMPVIVSTTNPLDDDDWGLSDFASAPSTSTTKSNGLKPELAARVSRTPSPLAQATTANDDPLDDFDFGNREDKFAADSGLTNDAEDDILGALAKPADALRKGTPTPSPNTRPSPSPRPAGQRDQPLNRSNSPPPHIIGQIVEMGFSPQQARVALAATDSGTDVQQALETLLQSGAAGGDSDVGRGFGDEGGADERRQRNRRFTYDDNDENPAHHPQRRATAPTHSQPQAQRGSPSGTGTSTPATSKDLQAQADKLLAQASEIGLSVFNKANAFWREKVQKAYEERTSAAASGSMSGAGGDGGRGEGGGAGRPKWMSEVTEERSEDDWGIPGTAAGGLSRVGGDQVDTNEGQKQMQAQTQREPPRASRVADLFSNDEPAYVSPFRRRPAPASKQTARPSKSPSPPPLRRRPSIAASASALSTSNTRKEKGTEMFKLGRYAEADALYSSALDVLPDKHLLRVPLYNNRALAKIRCGDHSGAVEDCTAVLEIIGTDYHPAREAKVTREECGAGVDIGTALAKAYRRRAEAYEGREKWELARKDWEAVVGLDWVGKERSDAVNGVTRCRKMEKLGKQPDADDAGARSSAGINDFAISQASPPPRKPASVPKPRVTKSAPTETFEAVTALRAANAQLEAEDALRHELKDRVDARLGAWKSGKETNLRALLASLDNVLWPELGWKNVGMAELVANTQVKVRYTKAIAKVHPDKLNPKNTTLEQRMIANGVFATLNEAWTAFLQ